MSGKKSKTQSSGKNRKPPSAELKQISEKAQTNKYIGYIYGSSAVSGIGVLEKNHWDWITSLKCSIITRSFQELLDPGSLLRNNTKG